MMDLRWSTAAEGESAVGWYNYAFHTRLDCALRCGPGSHHLYEGKTNRPWARVLEHAMTQPWFEYACGYEIYPEVYATERDALAAETKRIRENLPLANRAQNERNRHRLDFGQTLARAPRSRPAYRPVGSVPVRRRWTRRQRKAAVLAALWVALAVAGWVAAVRSLHATLGHGARDGVVGATALYVAAWWHRKPRRRRRPARRSRRRRR